MTRHSPVYPWRVDARWAFFEQGIKGPGNGFWGFQQSVDFSGATFSGEAIFRQATFSGEVYFLGATFSGQADFMWATFSDKAIFEEATFSGEADFGLATFSGEANFMWATFSGKAIFYAATFSGEATFVKTLFSGKAEFLWATFSGEADFGSATFSGQADFSLATFSDRVAFTTLRFARNTTFTFTRSVLRPEARLVFDFATWYCVNAENNKIPPETPHRVTLAFEGIKPRHNERVLVLNHRLLPAANTPNLEITFTDCEFKGENVIFNSMPMRCVTLTGGHWLAGMQFRQCDWPNHQPQPASKLLGWFQRKLLWGLQFSGVQLGEGISALDKAKIYAGLKQSAQSLGETQDANAFYFWQQYYRLQSGTLHGVEKAWNAVYLLTSAYGLSALRPFLTLFLVAVLSYGVLLSILAGHCTGFSWPLKPLFEPPILLSIGFSFPPILPLLNVPAMLEKLHLFEKVGVALWGIFQIIIQSYLLFQIGAAIRNKVKR